jgi:hypothetical protein
MVARHGGNGLRATLWPEKQWAVVHWSIALGKVVSVLSEHRFFWLASVVCRVRGERHGIRNVMTIVVEKP